MSDLGIAIAVVTLVAIAAVTIYKIVKGGATVETFEDALALFYQAERLVETYAPAADQLVATGKLKKEDRLQYVVNLVFSYLEGLDIKQVEGIVEAWVAANKKAQ